VFGAVMLTAERANIVGSFTLLHNPDALRCTACASCRPPVAILFPDLLKLDRLIWPEFDVGMGKEKPLQYDGESNRHYYTEGLIM